MLGILAVSSSVAHVLAYVVVLVYISSCIKEGIGILQRLGVKVSQMGPCSLDLKLHLFSRCLVRI